MSRFRSASDVYMEGRRGGGAATAEWWQSHLEELGLEGSVDRVEHELVAAQAQRPDWALSHRRVHADRRRVGEHIPHNAACTPSAAAEIGRLQH